MNINRIAILDRYGEVKSLAPEGKGKLLSIDTLPVIIDYYLWDLDRQIYSAEKHKDQIKRVFYQNEVDDSTKSMLKDDIQRLDVVQKFDYGSRILEIGSSDGSVSVKIAQQAKVKEILAIDIRQSAISDGKKLIRDLVRRGEITKETANKIIFKKCAIENLSAAHGQFDSVCAYEVFEHLTPWDMMPVLNRLYKFISPKGKFFVSVPNRFPNVKYDKTGRSRWKWFDHRNFFSYVSLKLLLTSLFNDVRFHSLYPNEKPEDGLYLICECREKKI